MWGVTTASTQVRRELFGGVTRAERDPAAERVELLRLGRSKRPWDFMARASAWLHANGADDVVRFLLAANFAQLGLKTLASEQLLRLPASATAQAGVRELQVQIDALPEDAVEAEECAGILGANLAVLGQRGIDLSRYWTAWRARASGVRVFRMPGGLTIRVAAKDATPDELFDHAAWATSAVGSAEGLHARDPQPVVIEGMDPPFVFIEAMRVTAKRANGICGRVDVLHADPITFLDALSLRDLGELLGEERTTFYVGPEAAAQAMDVWRSRLDQRITACAICVPGTTQLSRPSVGEAITTVLGEQEREVQTVHDRLTRERGGMDAAAWQARFAAALAAKQPLRFFIPTTRHSTFVQHSAQDIASALRRLGHETHVMVESNDFEQRSVLAYLREVERFKPDAMLVINYPRAASPGMAPAWLPQVCWIQDAMPHLFSSEIGKAQGELDFLVGHLHQELFSKHAYPRERALPAPVPVDSVKFHSGPIDASLRSRFECEIAMVSHHGETPRAMHERLIREQAGDARVREAFERINLRLPEAIEASMREAPQRAIARMVRETMRDVWGDEPETRLYDLVMRHYATPLADRYLRHQSVAWALDLARSKGWRVNLYGRGWSQDPSLAEFARGELSHGEELRAAYAAARVHLHSSLHSMVHQRVMECFLSSGFCTARLTLDALTMVRAGVHNALRHAPLDVEDGERVGYAISKHAEARAYNDLLVAFGSPDAGDTLWSTRARVESLKANAHTVGVEQDPRSLWGDLRETTFWDRGSFEARVTRAIEDDAWRASLIASAAERVRTHFTYDGILSRLLSLMAGGRPT